MRSFVVVLALLFASTAYAEDIATYEMEGDAAAGGADPRVTALDEAFARATQAAVHELVEPDVRKAHKQAIDRELVARARKWVAKFTVTKDTTNDGRRELTVLVRVDRDKLRARLGELGIPIAAAGEVNAAAKSAVVLLRISDPERVRATYGATAEKELPGVGALASALRGAGMAMKRAPASGPAAKRGEGLPLEDGDADALAAEAKADYAAVVGVSIGEPVAIRGVAMPGVLVTAHAKLIARGGKPLGHGIAAVAARGSEASVIDAAIERAIVAAAADVMPAPKQSLGQAPAFAGEDIPVADEGVVLVRLAPKTPWGLVLAEQRYLSGARGVQRAVVRRLSPGGWVIGVTTTESIERIAAIARRAPKSGTSAKVKIVGNIVEVTLSGSP